MESNKLINTLKSKKLTIMVLIVILSTAVSFTKVQAANVANRYNGVDRYETAAKVCEDGWKEDTDYAVVVNGENFPDAMSAAPLAKKYGAPILLTGKDILNYYTSVQLNRLNVKNVFIIGGKGVVSQSIEDALKARGMKITRLGGVDRYETGIQVAQKLGKATQIAVVNGGDFHDGMSMASIAAYKGMPIILTGRDSMPDSVKKYLQANKNADQIYVVGDSDQISNSVFSLIPKAKRIGSGDVYERNAAIISAFQNEVSTGTMYVASAKDFPDSLVASAVAPLTASPMLYVDSPMSSATESLLKSKIVNNIKILGGYGAVDYDTEYYVQTMPLDIASVDNYTDTIWQSQNYTPRPTILVTATDGSTKEVPVSWKVSNLNTTKPGVYTINGTIKGTNRNVITMLIVKPIPVKIDDLNVKTANGVDYSFPETVSAQMSDGTISRVPVTWEYGSQLNNKPGTYVFMGTVERYSKKVKLTITASIPPQILFIEDVKLRLNNLYDFNYTPYYSKIPAQMTDGTIKNEPVTWNMASISPYPGYPGVYQCTGTVDGYDDKVKAILIIGNANDPSPDIPTNPDNPDTNTNTTRLSPIDIMQGDPYNLPTTAVDPDTGKSLPVTWTTNNIDASIIDTDSVETSRVASIEFIGTLTGSTNKVSVVVNVRPKIMGIDPDSLRVTISRSDYNGSRYMLPTTVKAVMQDGSKKDISVLNWDVPYINISDSQVYNIKGRVKWYNIPINLNLTVTD